jgi:hypothetical protein
MIDDSFDAVSATLFHDRILYMTWSDTPVVKTVHLRSSDFGSNSHTGRPERFDYTLKMEPHSIQSIELH